jgi:hypothetical protein
MPSLSGLRLIVTQREVGNRLQSKAEIEKWWPIIRAAGIKPE